MSRNDDVWRRKWPSDDDQFVEPSLCGVVDDDEDILAKRNRDEVDERVQAVKVGMILARRSIEVYGGQRARMHACIYGTIGFSLASLSTRAAWHRNSARTNDRRRSSTAVVPFKFFRTGALLTDARSYE